MHLDSDLGGYLRVMIGPGSGLLLQILLFLHLLAVVIGFGSTFVWAMLAKQASDFDPAAAALFTKKLHNASKVLSTPFIYAAGATGLLLVVLGGNNGITFKQTWVSAGFALFAAGVLVSVFLQQPNQNAIVELQDRLAGGTHGATESGPPREVAELKERGEKAAMFGGMLHLIFLLLMIDMLWKPGAGAL